MFEQMNNNKVHLMGKITSLPKLSHEVYDERFFEINLEISRLSGSVDVIPIIVSEKLLGEYNFAVGQDLNIVGQFRSYNKQIDGKSKLVLTVFVREILEINATNEDTNSIELTGYICKEPIFRTTPFKREICDVLLAVNRAYNKSDYLPCIAWGRNARYVKNMKVGEKISIFGRIQSRNYEKKYDNGLSEQKTAYEISIIKILTGDSGTKEYVVPLNQLYEKNDTASGVQV